MAQEYGLQVVHKVPQKWTPPPENEFKCNIGVAWSGQKQLVGVSWVVRDSMGKVILHSRRSYSQVHSLLNANIKGWEWALQSMDQLQFHRVTFGASPHDLIRALHKPKDWPMMVGHIAELLSFTKDKQNWFMMMEPLHCNNGAYEIAKSGLRWQSYVARSFPQWLRPLFEAEMIIQEDDHVLPL